jgi:hypothetical protein
MEFLSLTKSCNMHVALTADVAWANSDLSGLPTAEPPEIASDRRRASFCLKMHHFLSFDVAHHPILVRGGPDRRASRTDGKTDKPGVGHDLNFLPPARKGGRIKGQGHPNLYQTITAKVNNYSRQISALFTADDAEERGELKCENSMAVMPGPAVLKADPNRQPAT